MSQTHTSVPPPNEFAALPPLRSRKNGHNAPEKNHAEMFDLVPGIVVVMDCEHTIIDLNREAARSIRKTRQECAGHKLWEYFEHRDCHEGKCAAAQAVQTGAAQEGIVHYVVHGSEVALLVTAAPRFGPDGTVIGVVQLAVPAIGFAAFSDEVGRIAEAVAAGNLNERVAAERFDERNRICAQILNKMLDAIADPVHEVAKVLRRMAANDLTQRAPDHFSGVFGELCDSANDAQDRVSNATRIMTNIASGDFQQDFEELRNVHKRSEKDALIPAFLQTMEAITALVSDARILSQAAVAGQFQTRADATRHNGDYRKVVQGINATLDTVVDKCSWYESIIDAVPFPIHVIDNDMNWVYLNRAFEKLMVDQGYVRDRKDAVGRPCCTANANMSRAE